MRLSTAIHIISVGKTLYPECRKEIETRIEILQEQNHNGCKDHWINAYRDVLEKDLRRKAPLPTISDRRIVL